MDNYRDRALTYATLAVDGRDEGEAIDLGFSTTPDVWAQRWFVVAAVALGRGALCQANS